MNEQAIGKNIRTLRVQTGLTLSALAKKADITKSALSKIETCQSSPPVSTLIRIARGIGVPVARFFEEQKKDPDFVLTPRGKGQIVKGDGSRLGYSYEALALEMRDKYVEPFILTIKPEDPAGTFHHSGQEFVYMLSGRADFKVGKENFILNKGDSLFFDSTKVYKIKAIGKQAAKFLCVFIQESPRTKK